jgi:hypothetical protein
MVVKNKQKANKKIMSSEYKKFFDKQLPMATKKFPKANQTELKHFIRERWTLIKNKKPAKSQKIKQTLTKPELTQLAVDQGLYPNKTQANYIPVERLRKQIQITQSRSQRIDLARKSDIADAGQTYQSAHELYGKVIDNKDVENLRKAVRVFENILIDPVFSHFTKEQRTNSMDHLSRLQMQFFDVKLRSLEKTYKEARDNNEKAKLARKIIKLAHKGSLVFPQRYQTPEITYKVRLVELNRLANTGG